MVNTNVNTIGINGKVFFFFLSLLLSSLLHGKFIQSCSDQFLFDEKKKERKKYVSSGGQLDVDPCRVVPSCK